VVTNAEHGPGLGGTRESAWSSDAEMVADNVLLAFGMEYKSLFHGLPYGGGKMCVQLSAGAAPERAYTALGRFVKDLQGAFVTTEDLGTTPEKMAVMHRVAPGVILGRPLAEGGSGDPSQLTAVGVVESIAAVSRRVLGRDLKRVRVWVKGLGHVGAQVARLLLQKGTQLKVCDLLEERLEPFRGNPRVEILPTNATAVEADIFAPCAKGGDVGPYFPSCVRAICGAANNQLTSDDVADLLDAQGIVYVPDWVVNGGGLISVAAEHLGHSREWAIHRARGIGLKVDALLEEAAGHRITPLQRAYQICESNRGNGCTMKANAVGEDDGTLVGRVA
jgi:leucine dehydrogenase